MTSAKVTPIVARTRNPCGPAPNSVNVYTPRALLDGNAMWTPLITSNASPNATSGTKVSR